MGFNSVVVVMNDAIGTIEKDHLFGKHLAETVIGCCGRGGEKDVPAYSYKDNGSTFQPDLVPVGVHCNAATVLSTAHADCPQVVVVKHNTGYVYKYKEVLPEHVLLDLKWVLEQHGFSIRKKTAKKVVK